MFPSPQLLKLFIHYYRYLNTNKLNYCKWKLRKWLSGIRVRSKMPDKIWWGHVTSSLALLPSRERNPSPRKLFITIPLNHQLASVNPTPLPYNEKNEKKISNHIFPFVITERAWGHLKVPELALSSRLAH